MTAEDITGRLYDALTGGDRDGALGELKRLALYDSSGLALFAALFSFGQLGLQEHWRLVDGAPSFWTLQAEDIDALPPGSRAAGRFLVAAANDDLATARALFDSVPASGCREQGRFLRELVENLTDTWHRITVLRATAEQQ